MRYQHHTGTLFLLWLGCSAVVSQAYYLRELLSLFSGNEFSLGIMLTVWLSASALGAVIGDRLSRSGCRTVSTLAGISLLAPLLPIIPVASQAYRSLSGLPGETSLSLGQIALASMLLLSLPAMLHGYLFPLASALANDSPDHQKEGAAGKGYAIESLGSLVGGLLAAFWLIPLVRPLDALTVTALAGLLLAALMARGAKEAKRGVRIGQTAVILVATGLLAVSLGGILDKLENRVIASAHPYARVLYSGYTRFQKLVLLSLGGQYTLMAGGVPVLTLPHPDDGSSEAVTIIPLMAMEKLSSVLVLGGLDTLPRQVAAIPSIRRIDCLETDHGLFDALKLIPDAERLLGLKDPRLRLIREDPRTWLNRTEERYDAVLVSLPPPVTLAANRFYSVEFYRMMARLIVDDGIAMVVVPASETYLTLSQAGLLASVSRALGEAMPYTLAIPGERALLLASRKPLAERIRPAFLTARMTLQNVKPRFLTADYLADRLSPERLSWLAGEMARSVAHPNRDDDPQGVRYGLACQLEQQGMTGGWWPQFLTQRSVWLVSGILLIGAVLPGLFFRGKIRTVALGAMAGTGFAAMTLQILLMLAYQSHTGLIYQGVALFTSTFMGGSAIGVYLAQRRDLSLGPKKLILLAEGCLPILSGFLAILFLSGFSSYLITALPFGGLLAGVLTGMEFHAVSRIIAMEVGGDERPGIAYAVDLLGGCLGGLLAGVVLIPLAGFGVTCVIIAAVKTVQMFMLITPLSPPLGPPGPCHGGSL